MFMFKDIVKREKSRFESGTMRTFMTSHTIAIVFGTLERILSCFKGALSLTFFALSEPIWVCDLGTGEKIDFFFN
jgi:hypothetical protein